MAELIWTDKSVSSLEDIYDYIADDSPYYARYQINSILKGAEKLKTFPESGRHIPEFPHLPHREFIVNAFRLIYRYDADKQRIYIVNVIHGRRLLTNNLLDEQ